MLSWLKSLCRKKPAATSSTLHFSQLTPEQQRLFNQTFQHMDDAFKSMDELFKNIKP